MDKIKLEYGIPEKVTIEHNNFNIEVIPYINFETQVFLIGNYIENYFGEAEEVLIEEIDYHYLEAECKLINYIYQLNTNIDVENSINDIYSDSVLLGKITYQITNWEQFRTRLDNIINLIKKQKESEYSLGKLLSKIIGEMDVFIKQLSEISPEDIKNLQETGKELIKELEESSVMKNQNDLNVIEEPLIEAMKDGIKKD